jgi:aspartokinase
MVQERIKAYKIISHQFLTLLRMTFFGYSNSPLGKVLENFQKRSLPVRFFTADVSLKGELTLNIGVDLLSEEMMEEVIDNLKFLENHYELALISQVSMAMVYGPHFGETPGIAGLTLSTLADSGISLLATTASSSSLSCIFPSTQFRAALEIFHAIFEPPQEYLYWRDNRAELLK